MRTTGFEVAMGEGKKGREDVGMRVCMCWGSMCVCVCEREKQRQREREREREQKKERKNQNVTEKGKERH